MIVIQILNMTFSDVLRILQKGKMNIFEQFCEMRFKIQYKTY